LFLYDCEIWYFRLQEEEELGGSENRVFTPDNKRDEVAGGWINCIMRSSAIRNVVEILLC
jgi:hypothetical protein